MDTKENARTSNVAEAIELGVASIETKGAGTVSTESHGREIGIGISEE